MQQKQIFTFDRIGIPENPSSKKASSCDFSSRTVLPKWYFLLLAAKPMLNHSKHRPGKISKTTTHFCVKKQVCPEPSKKDTSL